MRWVGVAVLVLGAAWAVTAWPRLNDVETGRTPEYPDLQVRTYCGVAGAGGGGPAGCPRRPAPLDRGGLRPGPGGTVVTAVHQTRLFRFEDDVTVRIRRQGGATEVSVRSQSRIGGWDFGQNARNVRELFGRTRCGRLGP